jgi:hypothetical protein
LTSGWPSGLLTDISFNSAVDVAEMISREASGTDDIASYQNDPNSIAPNDALQDA